MPIYEYYCEGCDKVFEIRQRITDNPKTTCEICQGKIEKQISLSSFHLKGSGWYVTDYSRKNGTEKANGTGKPEEKTAAETKSTENKTENKTSTKTENKTTTKTATKDGGKEKSPAPKS